MSSYALSDRLRDAGRPVSPSAVAKTERGERQVSVDELVALAIVLNVSPSALLLPPTDDPQTTVEITGAGTVPANEAWDWIDGKRRLDRPCANLENAALEFKLFGRPPIRRTAELAD
jgi:transcriptional regulator with XRE-family HTH domain